MHYSQDQCESQNTTTHQRAVVGGKETIT